MYVSFYHNDPFTLEGLRTPKTFIGWAALWLWPSFAIWRGVAFKKIPAEVYWIINSTIAIYIYIYIWKQ